MSEIPNVIDLIWRAAASFSGGLCYLVVRRDLPPRKAVGVIVTAIAFGLLADGFATAAQTVAELESEIRILDGLERQAKAVVASGQDRKWDELSKILQNNPEMHDAAGRQRRSSFFPSIAIH